MSLVGGGGECSPLPGSLCMYVTQGRGGGRGGGGRGGRGLVGAHYSTVGGGLGLTLVGGGGECSPLPGSLCMYVTQGRGGGGRRGEGGG